MGVYYHKLVTIKKAGFCVFLVGVGVSKEVLCHVK